MLQSHWKPIPIPGLEHLFATKEGIIGKINSRTNIIEPRPVYIRSNYAYISDWHLGRQNIYAVHRLVCAAFHPWPKEGGAEPCPYKDGIPFVPNHRDFNKLNNHKDNLEWTTQSNNTKHAFDSDIAKTRHKIEVCDLQTNKTKIYRSVSQIAQEFNLNISRLNGMLNSEVPYLNRYLFNILDLDCRNQIRDDELNILIYDYVTKKTLYVRSCFDASVQTSVNEKTISDRINKPLSGRVLKTIAGYEFFDIKNIDKNNLPDWLLITQEEAKKERELFMKKLQTGVSSHCQTVTVFNTETKEEKIYQSLKEAAKACGIIYHTAKNNVLKQNRESNSPLKIIGKYIFRYHDDTRPWEYSELVKPINRVILVKNITSGQINRYDSYKKAVDGTGLSFDSVSHALKDSKTGLRVRKGYIFKYEDDPSDWPM